MLKQFTEYSKMEQFHLIWSGIAGIVEETYYCQQRYLAYKENGFEELSEEQELEMKTLEFLKNLGYDLEEIGTYLYKEVIIKVANHLSNEKKRNNLEFCRDLIATLQNAYSGFYFDLARNDRDIGTKTFHSYIDKAHEKRDMTKVSAELMVDIYEPCSRELNFGESAFLLGNYVASNLMPASKSKPKEKQLCSIVSVS